MQDLIKSVLGDKAAGILKLLEGAGIPAGKAQGFLHGILEQVMGMVKSGKLDPSSLLGGGAPSAVTDAVDAPALAASSGVSEQTARSGVAAAAPSILTAIREAISDPSDLLKLAGGGGGLLGKLGGMFGG